MNLLSAVLSAAAEQPTMFFKPENFVKYLENMGVGMLVIFVIIGVIILTTVMVNKTFSD